MTRFVVGLCLIWILIYSVNAEDRHFQTDVSQWSLRQKVTQMFMVSFYGKELTQVERAFLQETQPGAVVLFGKNIESPEQVTRLTNDYQQTMIDSGGIPLLIAVDQEGGRIQHLQEGFTRFPLPMLWAATQDTDLAYEIGVAMATELRAVGVNMNLAPIADLNTNIENPIIGYRSFGSDGALLSPILIHFIRGLQDNGVVATAKHFPGHGDTSADSHLELPIVEHTMERLEVVELVPFRATIEANVGVMMVSHIWFTQIDREPTPASLSKSIVTGMLRNDLGYNGIIMTDALDMDAIDTVYTAGGSAVQAILAGNDLIAIGAHVGTQAIDEAIDDVVQAVENGEINIDQIDASVERILKVKQAFGVINWQPLDPFSVDDRLNLDAHDTLITRLFEQGVTLIDAEEMVPVQGQVAVIYPATRPRIAEECAGFVGDVRYTGVSGTPTDEEIQWAVTATRDADVVIVFTQNARTNLNQQRLVEALPSDRTIVAALWDTSDVMVFPDVAGYILGYSPILRATAVMCDILVGRRTAQGTFPMSYRN